MIDTTRRLLADDPAPAERLAKRGRGANRVLHGLVEQLRADPETIGDFVEEVLRLESPVQGLYRQAAVDTTIGEVAIPAGSSVWLVYAAANRDEAVFACPHQLDLAREANALHLAFGKGPHFCIGAALARLEARIGIEVLIDRLGDLALSDRNDYRYEPSYVLHGLKELHLQFRARPA